jgi:arylsulfatase A-like enzyme
MTIRRLAIFGLLLLVSCDGTSTPGRSVVFVTIDTTRADRIGVYGHPRARTPVLDRVARRGALVRDAIADVPVTLPSHATLFTGIPAIGHGVRFNADFKLGEDAETIAEVFAAEGWATGAVVSTPVLDSQFGIDQGFKHYDDQLSPGYAKQDTTRFFGQEHWLPKADRRADEAVDRALSWLTHAPAPFFFWLHIYDPHFPYDPPPPWGDGRADLYLAEIEATDRALGRLTRWIDTRDALTDPVLIVTSDHGEGLDDHREDEHGIFVYDETIRVPLVVQAPGIGPAAVVDGQVRTMDVAATVLELAGWPREFGLGRSLVPRLTRPRAEPGDVAYCESVKTKLFYGGSGLKSVRTADAKFVWAPTPELYDLRTDPGETRNLLRERSELAGRLRATLEDTVREILAADLATVEAANADESTLAMLASLGYVRGGDASAPGSFEREMELAGNDPKDLVDVTLGAHWIQNGFVDLGESKLLRFFRTARGVDEDPRMARLWAAAHQNYAKVWMLRADYDRAAEEYRRSMEADPTYENARWSRIYALNLARRHERAVREGGALLQRYPKAWRVRLHRALALALLGRRNAAATELRRVAAGAPASTPVSRNAGFFLDRIGGPEEAEALATYLKSS